MGAIFAWLTGKLGSTIASYMTIALVVLVLLLGGLVAWMKHDLKLEVQKNAVLQISVDQLNKVVASQKSDIAKIQLINQSLTETERADSQQQNVLVGKLGKLDAVAKKKPGLVTKIINKASDERNRCLALATGAKPLKGEKNSVCPQLVK